MRNHLYLLMAATLLLYLGPLLAGLAGFGWNLVWVFAAIFLLWLTVLRPHLWPRTWNAWGQHQAWVTLGTNGAVQLLLVTVLFGIGRGIGGALGFVAPFPAALPVLVSLLSIPLSRLVWNPQQDTEIDHFLDDAIHKVAHVDNPVERSDLNRARFLIGPLGNLPDDTDTNEIARHLHAISRHAEEVHIRTALMERQRSGHATYAQTLALILHATDGTLIGRVGGDGPTLALSVLPHDPDLIALYARRLTAALDQAPELWGQCPTTDLLLDLAEELNDTPAEAPLRALIDATNRAQPEDGLA